MRTTITISDELLEKARRYSGSPETSAIVSEALTAFIQREAGRRLAKLGGSDPKATAGQRRGALESSDE